jgi:hypothetical protein
MIEKCKMCGVDGTPWTFVSELMGHVCEECSFILSDVDLYFMEFINKLGNCYIPETQRRYEDYVRPRTIKKAIYASVRRWCKLSNEVNNNKNE